MRSSLLLELYCRLSSSESDGVGVAPGTLPQLILIQSTSANLRGFAVP
jgi:hypothetical protein